MTDEAATPVLSEPDDLDLFVYEMGDRARDRLDGVLPDGFTLRQQKNGKWVGKWPRGVCKDIDRRWVESLLFMVAASDPPTPEYTELPTARRHRDFMDQIAEPENTDSPVAS